MTLFSSKCEVMQKEALAHLEGETSALEKARFLSHLEKCEACRTAVEEVSGLLEAVRKERYRPTSATKDRMFESIIMRLEDEPSEPRQIPSAGSPRERMRPGRRVLWTMAAAAMMLVAFSVWHLSSSVREAREVPTQASHSESAAGEEAAPRHLSPPLSTVRLAAHLTVGVTPAARWKISEEGDGQIILVETGTLWIRYNKKSGTKPLAVRGSGLTATVVGTVLTVRAEPGRVMEIGVLEGRVEVVSDLGEQRILGKGEWRSADGKLRPMASEIVFAGRNWLDSLPMEASQEKTEKVRVSSTGDAGPKEGDEAPSPKSLSRSKAVDLYRRAETAMQQGRYSVAAGLLEKLIRRAPGSEQSDTARLDLAGIYTRRLSKPKRAAYHLHAFLKRHPKGARAGLVTRRLCRLHADRGVEVDVQCD